MNYKSSLVLAARSIRCAISCNCSRCSLVRPFGAGAAEQALDFAPDLEHQQLTARIDVRDQNAFAWQYSDQAFARQPLQSLADGRTPDL